MDEIEPPAETLGQTIARNLKHLFATYGGRLGIPEGTASIVKHYENVGIRLSATTIRGFLEAHGSTRPHDTTLEQLVGPFKPLLVRIQGHWLLTREPNTFSDLLNTAIDQDSVRLDVPNYRKRIPTLARWLGGTYVAYRHSFESQSEKDVAREVVHIWLDKDSVLRFRMSFWSLGSEAGQEALEFEGPVLPIGEAILFLGINTRQAQYDRARTFFLHNDRAEPRLRDCALGILSSTRLHGDWAPCVACTLLVRVNWTPPDMKKFIQDVTRIDDTGLMIRQDFGAKHETWIRAFLNNRPRGTNKDPELAKLDRDPNQRDFVLRLDRGRFNDYMPNILAEVISDTKIRAPFKRDWAAPSAKNA